MATDVLPLVLDPARAWSMALPEADGRLPRFMLRALLALSAGAVRIEGVERLTSAPRPAIFALSHHNQWEAILAPTALMAVRGGRPVRFLADWMYVDLPWTGWLLRQSRPIPVYTKPSFGRLFDRRRRRKARFGSPIDRALAALAAGDDVGIYPEGRCNPDAFQMLRGRSGVAILALRSGAAVVPVGVDFAARDQLQRTPRAGRFSLRIGEPLEFVAARREWLEAGGAGARRDVERRRAPELVDRVLAEVAKLARKVYFDPRRRLRPAANDARVLRSDPETVVVARRVDVASRAEGLAVLAEVYATEKGWLERVDGEIPLDPAADDRQSWFLVRSGGEPAGLLRVAYDPPLELPADAEVEIDSGVDLEALARRGRFVEIGRLTVRPRFRRQPSVVLGLIRAAVAEIRRRGYTHLLTAVFEDDPHSPYGFHTRVLGFERIGTHRRGELRCASRRILLVLDLERAARRLSRGANRMARLVGEALADAAGPESEPAAVAPVARAAIAPPTVAREVHA